MSASQISGWVAPGFEPLREAFALNFAERDELGASVALHVGGRPVADLWGGHIAPGGAVWQADTVHVLFSCTKPAAALCLHLLAARGAVDLDAPLSQIWPELGAAEAGGSLRMMLDHSLGLPALRTPVKPDALTDSAYMVALLEKEEPFWSPGHGVGYHALTYGFLVGEVVRRVTGQSLGDFFRDEIAAPLQLDLHIGLPESAEPRVAPIIPYRPGPDEPASAFMQAARQKGSPTNLFTFNSGDWAVKGVNTRAGRAAEIGAAGGVGNARAMAELFAALAEGGERLGLAPDQVAGFTEASSATHCDAVLRVPTRFGPGFMLRMDNRAPTRGGEGFLIGDRAFGHVGAGGSVAFADPQAGIGFAYTMNRLGPGLLLSPRNGRAQALIDAAYACLGYQLTDRGHWTREPVAIHQGRKTS
ncbi:serine hydrolase [Phaeobacter gallaeciensis]|uniref:serine hydrolase domain-containing protein n=1 Tax=Phaeobacter gallaeciensis TaxID=60890 RepID=UPI0023801578|nr:serine hydrolase domain-containing protein [Phaeobacter gallaeciensis]MDE4276785.1 serine hydrolase [Phaeobacter gallaeciensis]MDE4302013.1 serine hydrolase [Phaeobacter gallaeciensis]MDE5187209.1 serine hydrolase [Phaeobacter gallaeciensis]